MENDLIEAIIALPTDLFYNTGIATYIWVLSRNKRQERKGYVQLIDASSFCHKLRRSLGSKRNEISPEDRAAITKLYADFEPGEFCRIYRNEEFMYREYTVMQPLQRSYAITPERIEAMFSKGALSGATADRKLLERIADGLSIMDKRAEIQRDRKGEIIYDRETKDTETFAILLFNS